MRLPSLVLLLSIAPAALAGGITVQWPNGGAPCNAGTTLQECIDGVPDGSTIVLNTATPIDEWAEFGIRQLTLRGYPGFAPTFSINGGIAVHQGEVRIENIIFDGSQIRATNALLDLHRLEFRNVRQSAVDLFEASSIPSGPMRLRVSESRFVGLGDASGFNEQRMVSASRSTTGTLAVDIDFNTFRPDGDAAQMIELYCGGDTSDCSARIAHNDIRGTQYNGGVQLRVASNGHLQADVLGNLIVGQWGNTGMAGSITADTNAGSGTIRVINNTIVGGRSGIALSPRADLGGTVDGLIANNLITDMDSYSVCVQGDFALRNNLTWDNAGDIGPLPNTGSRAAAKGFIGACQPAGSGNVYADPKLDAHYRLRADSPARNAADPAALQAEIDASRAIDLDGLRRVVGAAPDIGAYEHDTRLRTQRFTDAVFPLGLLSHPRFGDAMHPYPLVSPFHGPPQYPVVPPSPLLLMPYPEDFWKIVPFSGTDPLLPGVAFAVFAPQPQIGVAQVMNHGGNSRVAGTGVLTDTVTVTEGDPMFFVRTSTGSGAGSPTCRIGGVTEGGYVLHHPDNEPMNLGTTFHVYTQDASPNVFTFTSDYYTTGPFGQWVALDHPRLNGNACARILVAPADCANQHHIAARFGTTRWEIYNTDGAPIEYGTKFDVLLDPRQIDAECGVAVFSDGFE